MQEESPDTALLEEPEVCAPEDVLDEEDIEEVLAEFDPDGPPAADTNGSGELTEDVTVVFDAGNETVGTTKPAAAPELEPEPEPALGAAAIDRLVLTAANYFAVRPEKVTDSKKTSDDAVTARVIVFSLLENEFGMARKQVAAHFDRTTNSLKQTLNGDRNRERLKTSRAAADAIAEGFRVNDTFEERAEAIRKEREAEARRISSRRRSEPQPEREVPQVELDLFRGVREENKSAVRKVVRRYLKDVKEAMTGRASELGIELPGQLPRESLLKTARNFHDVASKHDDFLSWAEKVAKKDVELLAEQREREEVVRETGVEAFFSDVYEAYWALYGKGQWNQASRELSWSEHGSLRDETREIFEAYKEDHPDAGIGFAGFRKCIENLYKTNVLLRDPEKGTKQVANDSLARRAVITEFPSDRRRELLRLALKSLVRDGVPKRK